MYVGPGSTSDRIMYALNKHLSHVLFHMYEYYLFIHFLYMWNYLYKGYFIYPHFDLRPMCILKLFNSIWIISPGFVMAENASGSKTVFTNRRTHLDIMVYVYIHAFSYKTDLSSFSNRILSCSKLPLQITCPFSGFCQVLA